jgi:hypothetical protein
VKTPGTAIANLFSGNEGLPQATRPSVSTPRPRVRLVSASKQTAVAPPEPAKIVLPVVTIEVFRGSNLTEIKVKPQENKQ